jgi:hypothetical protein
VPVSLPLSRGGVRTAISAEEVQEVGIECGVALKPAIKSFEAVVPIEFVNQFEKDPRAETPDQFALPLSPKLDICDGLLLDRPRESQVRGDFELHCSQVASTRAGQPTGLYDAVRPTPCPGVGGPFLTTRYSVAFGLTDNVLRPPPRSALELPCSGA